MPERHTMESAAAALDVDVQDVWIVAQIELTMPTEFDPDGETLSDDGLKALRIHFSGGQDPE